MRIALLPAAAGALLLSGCYMNLAHPNGTLAVKLDADSANKQGTAECTGFLWGFAVGDCSVDSAMHNGHITKVHHVDGRAFVLLYGLYSTETTVVHGE